MDHFGLRSVKDLPKLKDIQPGGINEIGMPAEMMDDSREEVPLEEAVASYDNDEQEPSVSEEYISHDEEIGDENSSDIKE